MILHTFNNQGFTNNLNVFKELNVLDKIKQKIYEYTKDNPNIRKNNPTNRIGVSVLFCIIFQYIYLLKKNNNHMLLKRLKRY